MTKTFTKDELSELLSEEDLDALMRARSSKLSKLTVDLDELAADDDGQYDDKEFTRICEDRQKFLMLSDVEKETASRWADVEALRDHYALFEDFLYDCMTELMGFKCSELQIDIGRFLQSDV
jgi:hypothetical protein